MAQWRILVVDDEPDVRLIIRTTLEPKYEVVEAHDGLDALEKIERYEPDFVLMDVMMPLMNGFDACAAIRKSPRFAELPVMFLSALGSKEDMRKGFTSGANFYLTKPFDPARLLKNIDVFFEKTPPAMRQRQHTIESLREADSSGRVPVAPGSPIYERVSTEVPQVPATAEIPLPSGHGPMPRVMVVDDDPQIIELMKLSLDGVTETVSASDGMEAIERLVRFQPDILILDIMLPKMNGLQLCQSLRSNRAFGRLPIMICSAKGADRDVTFAKRIGANEYLVKPFSPADLIAKVKELTRRPGFRVGPKTFSIEQIRSTENKGAKQDVFTADDEGHREGHPSEGKRAIANFLQKEGQKDALDISPESEQKKKRRFFGLGGRD